MRSWRKHPRHGLVEHGDKISADLLEVFVDFQDIDKAWFRLFARRSMADKSG
jgi:hypothetical protein